MDGVFYISFRFVVATVLITWLACEIPFELRQLGPDKPILLSFTYATEWAFILYTFTAIAFAAFCIYYSLNKGKLDGGELNEESYFTVVGVTQTTVHQLYCSYIG